MPTPTARNLLILVVFVFTALVLPGCTREDGPDLAEPVASKGTAASQPVRFTVKSKTTDLQRRIAIRAAAPFVPNPPRQSVRGIYVSTFAALSGSKMKSIRALLNNTELNAVVLDVNSGARLLSLTRTSDANRFVRSETPAARRLRAVVRDLKNRRVYVIARIVSFKDTEAALARPDLALKRKDGTVWTDRRGHAWLDPYNEEAWAYPAALAQEAAASGFDEVQFDYVRFPDIAAKADRDIVYPNSRGRSKSEAIRQFLRFAAGEAHARGLRVSADVFGMVGSTASDMGIGQRWVDLAPVSDVLSPMVYPSHYNNGTWGIPNPDLTPAPVVTKAMQDAFKRNKALRREGKKPAEVRPWLQGFTASWVQPHQVYGPDQIREQIRAAKQAGFPSYLIWNSSSRYPVF